MGPRFWLQHAAPLRSCLRNALHGLRGSCHAFLGSLWVDAFMHASFSDLIGSVGKQMCARIGDRNSELCAWCSDHFQRSLGHLGLFDCLTSGAATPTACNNTFVFLDFHRSPARTVLKAPISQVVKKRNPTSLFRARLDRALEASPPAQSRVIDLVQKE